MSNSGHTIAEVLGRPPLRFEQFDRNNIIPIDSDPVYSDIIDIQLATELINRGCNFGEQTGRRRS
jgi:hypothetical protein